MSTKNNKKVVDRIPLKVKKPVSHKKQKIEIFSLRRETF